MSAFTERILRACQPQPQPGLRRLGPRPGGSCRWRTCFNSTGLIVRRHGRCGLCLQAQPGLLRGAGHQDWPDGPGAVRLSYIREVGPGRGDHRGRQAGRHRPVGEGICQGHVRGLGVSTPLPSTRGAAADSVEPFLADDSKGVFVWCRGSNPGSGGPPGPAKPPGDASTSTIPCAWLACLRRSGMSQGNVGLVVGATVPEQLASVREMCPRNAPAGARSRARREATLKAAVRAGVDSAGRLALINSSRGIIYASSGG